MTRDEAKRAAEKAALEVAAAGDAYDVTPRIDYAYGRSEDDGTWRAFVVIPAPDAERIAELLRKVPR
jgi:hypothetical protein